MLLIPILALTQHCSGEARNLVMHMLSCSPSSSVLLIKYSSHIHLSKDSSSPLPSLESVATLMFFLSSFALLQKAEQIWDQEQREFTVKKNLSELRLLYQGGTWGILWCFAVYCLCQHSPPVVPRIHRFCQRVTQLCWYCDISFPEHTKPLNEAANSLDPVSEHLHNIILLVTGSRISLIGTARPYHPPH